MQIPQKINLIRNLMKAEIIQKAQMPKMLLKEFQRIMAEMVLQRI